MSFHSWLPAARRCGARAVAFAVGCGTTVAGAQTPMSPGPEPRPPPISAHYLQYGVAFLGQTLRAAGSVCPRAPVRVPCIVGDGGGLSVRVGYRSRGPWYLGGRYEFVRLDSSNLLRLAILQQLRAEARYYLSRVTRVAPYLGGSLGGLIYGSEWGARAWGGGGSVDAGLEVQVSSRLVVDFGVGYRPVLFRRWRDSAGELRADGPLGFGAVQHVGLQVGFDIREPLARW